MRLRHIEVLNAIMITGTVSAAARLLNLTQPAVTHVLKSAELQLGYPLFDRVRGRLVPSREALMLYPKIQRLEQQLSEIKTLAANLKQGAGTLLRVVAAPALAQSVLPRALDTFLASCPDVQVSVYSQYSYQVRSSLALQEADVGFYYHSVSHPVIIEETLGESELVCVTDRKLWPRRSKIRLQELSGKSVLNIVPDDPLGHLIHETCVEQNIAFSAQVFVQAYQALIAMVAEGLGVGLVDSLAARSVDHKVLRVLAVDPCVRYPVRAGYATTMQRSNAVRELIHHVQSTLQSCTPPGRRSG